jgi:hypothetical protein
MLALPVVAQAQEATLSGTVSDTTGGALPGVTVRAVHEASGNSFEAVTDARGIYRLAVRVGAYRVTAELAGFAPVTRTLTLLVGQEAVVNLQMAVSGLEETVTVTGEAPLLDVRESTLGGNIDPRQMENVPVQGRNWIDLLVLAPGARLNSVDDQAMINMSGSPKPTGDFQLNIDGQQVTVLMFGGQPRFSRDAIAEFEYVSSRFDATQGRSVGLQINAITKSGTNTPAGTFSGYFRHDRFNAADHVAKRVLPYQNQQLVGTFGSPIRKDRVHFFANYEYEREPQTVVYTTPYPHFNLDQSTKRAEKKGGGRLDAQFSPRTRLAVRGTAWRAVTPLGGGGTSTPSALRATTNRTWQVMGTLTQVFGSRAVNEVKVGYASFFRARPRPEDLRLKNPSARFSGRNGPLVSLRGLNAGGERFFPQDNTQKTYSVRNDFTYSLNKGGAHALKLGAEYLFQEMGDFRCIACEGELIARGGAIPANIGSVFPDLFDVSTWNLAPLSSITTSFRQPFAPSLAAYKTVIPRYTSAFWVQDDWTIVPRLTLNLGLRYDLEINAFANDVEILPFLPGNRPDDTNNVAPRLGFSFSLTDRTVVRGGYGLYFATVGSPHYVNVGKQTVVLETFNDGRPDFASNPYNGPAPTYESIVARQCTPALERDCLRKEFPTTGGGLVFEPGFQMPYSHQASIGLQRQVGDTMAIEADYVYVGARDLPREVPMNLTYDPATGANYPSTDVSRKPYPDWGWVSLSFNGYRSNQHSLQTAFTKRLSNGWQASGTYTLSVLRDALPPPRSGLDLVPFPTAPDLGGEYRLADRDQRHRAVVNGIWELGYGFQLSGLYFFGSGERREVKYGNDLRRLGNNLFGEERLRPDGTIIPRNYFVGEAIHRVDLRIQRRFPLGGRGGIDGYVEVYNVFNHANYGLYTTVETNTNFGRPSQDLNVAYAPRTLQLGFRLAF